jgi:hypothetical protein
MPKSLVAVRNMQKPSWCFEVIVMYGWPAASARPTHARASNPEELKSEIRFW